MKPNGTLALVLAATMLVACSPSSGPGAGEAPTGPASPGAAASAPAADAVDDVDSGVATGTTRTGAATPVAPLAGGREIEPEALPLIQGAAKIAAAVVACDLGTRAQAEQGFADQRAAYVERGYSAASFDRAVDAAFRETNEKFKQASADEQAKACESMAQLGEQFKKMGEEMQRQ